ncbi:copper chaperone PCu(A)C [Geodermatophilus sp. DSM 44513]|uniref:copper chaperone PCu(A)C n=1 Tax=Geodermatophilus sp. DSM 44513 TaxID=1528104 RepID=UPI00127352E6|nr:copper chaperone PCu(A)C [Geodermatophilus sp. DSM 44513]WNV77671.1 copper chaperone PCu(A)C [Geodermatophilus sp. DSM 44513]
MTAHPMSPPPRSRRLAAALVGATLVLGACGEDEDNPLQDDEVEVQGGAVGPDVMVNDDLELLQVQLAYPLDGTYEEGEAARLFFAVSNTGSEPATITDISGPDFSGVQVEKTDGQGLPLQVDADDNLYVGAEGPPDVTLLDLDRSLRSSQSIPVTFTFAEAGEITVDAMVSAEEDPAVPPFDFPDDDPDQDPTDDDSPAPSPTSPTG